MFLRHSPVTINRLSAKTRHCPLDQPVSLRQSEIMKHWLYDRRTLLLLLAILFGIQLFIFFVYDLNPDALGYMMLLEFVLINIYLVLDYWRHTLSHRFLTAQRKVPDLSWMEFDGTLKDRDYQRIIRQREKLRHEQAEQYRRDQQHM